ncbi:ribonuclease P protein subunit p30 isoform X1 [Melospiza melodia melodia]|uniref:ribonuclease P protein subunit p30 isoform X1 n=1 Tax=Melospiza melodia melodia TaxID=1914991 RepID=UPI002FD1770C
MQMDSKTASLLKYLDLILSRKKCCHRCGVNNNGLPAGGFYPFQCDVELSCHADVGAVFYCPSKLLQLLVQCVQPTSSFCATTIPVGYSVVALNHVIDFKEKKQEIIKPVSPSELFPSLPIVQGTSKRIKVLTRLTLVVSDPSHCNLLRSTSANIRLYDIIAVFPKTEKLFHIACTTLDVDLVCINVTEKLPFYFRRPPVNMAIDRGIYFELLYTPAIKDSTMRRYTISNAISLMQICKGKNIVISSAAERPLELRGPYDVANLGLLFGLSEGEAKAAVSTNCRATMLHGETRKSACGVVYTVKKPRKVEEEETAVPACKKAKTQA